MTQIVPALGEIALKMEEVRARWPTPPAAAAP